MPPLKMKKIPKMKVKGALKDKSGMIKAVFKGFLTHIGLLIVVIIYAILGAYILIGIEKEEEEKKVMEQQIATKEVDEARNYIVDYVYYLHHKTDKEKEFLYEVNQHLSSYHNFIVDKALNSYYDSSTGEWNYDWTFSKSFLFTFTTMGAIGYGHITPKTDTGQLFTIYYGMIGVPLLLLFLANIGEFLASSFRYIYSRLCCRMCRIRRKVSELKKKETLKPKVLWKEEVGSEPYMPTSHMDVPIVINLCVIFVYLMMGGALFSYWENWEMHEGVYFTFVTLTTIGFGDYVPGNSFSTDGNSLSSTMKMIVTIAFCMFGMALLSMAINLMQEQLVVKAKWLAKEMGISKNPEDAGPKYEIKRPEPGTVLETPPDKDGNQWNLSNFDEEKLKQKENKKAAKKLAKTSI